MLCLHLFQDSFSCWNLQSVSSLFGPYPKPWHALWCSDPSLASPRFVSSDTTRQVVFVISRILGHFPLISTSCCLACIDHKLHMSVKILTELCNIDNEWTMKHPCSLCRVQMTFGNIPRPKNPTVTMYKVALRFKVSTLSSKGPSNLIQTYSIWSLAQLIFALKINIQTHFSEDFCLFR